MIIDLVVPGRTSSRRRTPGSWRSWSRWVGCAHLPAGPTTGRAPALCTVCPDKTKQTYRRPGFVLNPDSSVLDRDEGRMNTLIFQNLRPTCTVLKYGKSYNYHNFSDSDSVTSTSLQIRIRGTYFHIVGTVGLKYFKYLNCTLSHATQFFLFTILPNLEKKKNLIISYSCKPSEVIKKIYMDHRWSIC